MITLALDTSTIVGSVALLRDNDTLGERVFNRSLPGENLFDAAQALLRENKTAVADIEFVAVGIGPGSFAGIRAGIAAAKGLALPCTRSIKAVSSFDVLAMRALPEMPRDCRQLCVLSDARRGEVYYAFYDGTGLLDGECRIGPLESVVAGLHAPVWFVSSEIGKFGNELRALCGGFASVCPTPRYPSASALGKLARDRFRYDGGRGDEQIEPIYLRVSQYVRLR
jgi:tRNA threonylcarbamoyladenosine biosynthesis protein TsaB